MDRGVYISNGIISLSEYIDLKDDYDRYNCWNDEETQSGYNHKMVKTFEEWKSSTAVKSRFNAVIVRVNDHTCIGSIFLSPEDTPPDLAIMIYRPYRKHGHGTMAFALGVRYCFETLMLDNVYAGCYAHNIGSMKMLKKCGFIPHPEGNIHEKHYITGEDIIQYDFVRHRSSGQISI